MKAQFLKLAGVKTEKEFYDKFPTEESFMAKYGKQLKKAQAGFNFGSVAGQYMGAGVGNAASQATNNAFSGAANAAAMGAMGSTAGFSQYAANNMAQEMSNMAMTGQVPETLAKQAEQMKGIGNEKPKEKKKGFLASMSDPGQGVADQFKKGIDALKAERERKKAAKQSLEVTDLALDAVRSDNSAMEANDQRQAGWVRPEDNIMTGEELFPVYGVGTNVLAKKGTNLPKYNVGGAIGGAASGAAGAAGKTGMSGLASVIGNGAQGLSNKWTQGSGGAQMGAATASVIGMIPGIGPIAKAALGPVLSTAGHALFSLGNKNKTKKYLEQSGQNVQDMMYSNQGYGSLPQNKAFMQQGGTLQGGEEDVNTLWGGHAQPLSYNPYAPGDGQMDILRGQGHDESTNGKAGIGLEYDGKMVEAEKDEPLVKLPDESLSIMGDRPLPKGFAKAVESSTGEKIKGGKFKTFIKNLGEAENKQNNRMDKNIEKAEKYTPYNRIDRISLDTLRLNNEKVYKPKLAKLQEAKEGAAYLQDAINETYDELGIESIDGKGKVKRKGKLPKAQNGLLTAQDIELQRGNLNIKPIYPDEQPIYNNNDDSVELGTGTTPGSNPPFKHVPKNKDGLYGDVSPENIEKFQIRNNWFNFDKFDPTNPSDVLRFQQEYNKKTKGRKLREDGKLGPQTYGAFLAEPVTAEGLKKGIKQQEMTIPELKPLPLKGDPKKEDKKSPFNYMDVLNQIPSLFGNETDAEDFDTNQLIPEMWALANNQLEAVNAQKYQPLLDVPYDQSLQDMLNANQSDYNAQMRMLGNNQGAAGMLQAQKYAANQRVLGEQFRLNQGMKDRVYSKNRDTLNDAQLKNLSIMDTQYQRQSQARSNTKATKQAAINSITDKIAKHALENKTLRIWENMYDYRYGADGRAQYLGPAANFDEWKLVGPNEPVDESKWEISRDKDGRIIKRLRQTSKAPNADPAFATPGFNPIPTTKNGGILKAYKKY